MMQTDSPAGAQPASPGHLPQPAVFHLQALEEQRAALQSARQAGQESQVPTSDSSAQLASKAQEVYRLQEDLLQQRKQLALQEVQAQEHAAALQASKNRAQQAEDDGHRCALSMAMARSRRLS